MNGDGLKDLVLGQYDATNGTLVWFAQKKDGTLTKKGMLKANGKLIKELRPLSVEVDDLDNDGLMDIVVSRCYFTAGCTRIYYNKGTASKFLYKNYDTLEINGIKKEYKQFSTSRVDLDGDGVKDLYYTSGKTYDGHSYVGYFYSLNSGTNTNPVYGKGVTIKPMRTNYRASAAAGDLNGDGRNDLLITNSYRKGNPYTGEICSRVYVKFALAPVGVESDVSVAELSDNKINAVVKNGELILSGVEKDIMFSVTVVDSRGRIMLNRRFENSDMKKSCTIFNFSENGFARGLYFIKIDSSKMGFSRNKTVLFR